MPEPPGWPVVAFLGEAHHRDRIGLSGLHAPFCQEAKFSRRRIGCYQRVDDLRQSVEGDGRMAIEKWLAGYFKSLPDVRAEIFDVTQTGPHVSFRERASWTAKDGTRRAQSALGIYEVIDGKVRHAWYFPAAREAAPPAKQ